MFDTFAAFYFRAMIILLGIMKTKRFAKKKRQFTVSKIKFCPCHNFLLPSSMWMILKVYVISLKHVISKKSWLQCAHKQNVCLVNVSSLLNVTLAIFHKLLLSMAPRVCYNFEGRSYHLGQGYSAHIVKIRFQAITLLNFSWI